MPKILVITPASKGTAFAITALNFTKLFPINLKKGELIAVSAGKFAVLDSQVDPFTGGGGHTKFFNVAFNGNPVTGTTVKMIVNGATFAYLRKGSPLFAFALFDSNGSYTHPGLKRLFADGVTVAPGLNFATKFGGKSGKQAVSVYYSTKKFSNFENLRDFILPGPPIGPYSPKKGSWALAYSMFQYYSEKTEKGVKTGWGMFASAGVADKDTNPVQSFFNIGIGGNGVMSSRPNDRFGVGFYYTGISDTLKSQLRPLTIAGDEKGFEAYYNFAITPFLTFTADLQVVRPALTRADTAVIPGARLVINF